MYACVRALALCGEVCSCTRALKRLKEYGNPKIFEEEFAKKHICVELNVRVISFCPLSRESVTLALRGGNKWSEIALAAVAMLLHVWQFDKVCGMWQVAYVASGARVRPFSPLM